MSALDVLIVDDHRLFAESMAPMLRALGSVVLRVAVSAAEALKEMGRRSPDVVLLDLGLPDESGLVLGARIVQEYPSTKVLALSALDDPAVVQEAVRVGFHGYLTKDLSMEQVLESLRSALDGNLVVQYRKRREFQGDSRSASAAIGALTARERDVLVLLARGRSSPEIAEDLFISSETVRTYVHGLLAKLGVHSRLEAVAFARRHGFVEQPEPEREWERRA